MSVWTKLGVIPVIFLLVIACSKKKELTQVPEELPKIPITKENPKGGKRPSDSTPGTPNTINTQGGNGGSWFDIEFDLVKSVGLSQSLNDRLSANNYSVHNFCAQIIEVKWQGSSFLYAEFANVECPTEGFFKTDDVRFTTEIRKESNGSYTLFRSDFHNVLLGKIGVSGWFTTAQIEELCTGAYEYSDIQDGCRLQKSDHDDTLNQIVDILVNQ